MIDKFHFAALSMYSILCLHVIPDFCMQVSDSYSTSLREDIVKTKRHVEDGVGRDLSRDGECQKRGLRQHTYAAWEIPQQNSRTQGFKKILGSASISLSQIEAMSMHPKRIMS